MALLAWRKIALVGPLVFGVLSAHPLHAADLGAKRVAIKTAPAAPVKASSVEASPAKVPADKVPVDKQPQQLSAQFEQLLELGRKSTPQAIEAARSCYEALREKTRGDARVEYAYGLVLVEQHRYADANKQLSAIVKADPTDLHAWRLKIWAQMLQKSYDGALGDMQRLAKLYPQAGAAVAPGDAEFLQDTAFLCGQMCGYLEGPRAEAVKKLELERAIRRIQDAVGPTYQGSFVEGRTDVVGRFEQAQRELEQVTLADQRTAEKKRQSNQKRVELEKANLDDRRAGLETKAAGLERVAGELAAVASQLRSLLETRQTVDDRVTIMDAQLSMVNNDKSSRRDRQTPTNADFTDRLLAWQRNADQTSQNNARTAERNEIVRNLNRQMEALNAQIFVLQSRRAALAMQLQVEGGTLDRRTASLAKAEKIVKQSERKQQHARPAGASAEARELTARMRSLRGYEEFPGDAERQHVRRLWNQL